ncbi:MAG: TonB-dependent Receptor Plug domain-containing protein, partial [bacterium]
FSLGRSLSQFDARHRLVFSYQYDIPFKRLFKNSSNRFIEGWSISGITSFQSGFPIRLQDFTDASLTGTSGDFESTDTPDQVSPVRILEPRKNNLYFFDPSSFRTVPDNEFGRFGTASRQFFSGPGINNWDIAILKTTRLTEKQTLEFRLEGFNLFNHAQFLNPDGIITDGERFGRIFRVREPRSIQLALKLLF